MLKKTIGLVICLGLFSQLYAHKDDVPNNRILSWDKLEIVVSYNEDEKTLQVKGHAHFPNGTKILVTLKFSCERYALENRTVIVNGQSFDCVFGPFDDKELLPGDYEMTCWFVMEQQSKDLQNHLLNSNFFSCNPPCRFDFQHYQTEIVSIGDEKTIEDAVKENEKKVTDAYKKMKDGSQKILSVLQNKIKALSSVTDKDILEKELKALYYEIDNLRYEIREVEQDLIEFRESHAYIYYLSVYERILGISSVTDILKNAVKRSWNRKSLDTFKNLKNFTDSLEEELKLIPELIQNNLLVDEDEGLSEEELSREAHSKKAEPKKEEGQK